MCACVCVWRKGGHGCRFRGQAPVWDTCSMECWEKTKQMGAPCCCVADCLSLSLLRTHSLTLPSPISEHKVWGPSCVTKMKQAKTTLSEPGTTYIEAHMKAREPLKVVKRPLHSAGSGGPVNLSDSCTHHKVSCGSFD